MTSDDDSGRVALTVHGVAGAVDLENEEEPLRV